jgi:hypothetical protein
MKTPEHTVFAMTAEPSSARWYLRSASQDAATTTPTTAIANSQGQNLRDNIVEASFAGIE